MSNAKVVISKEERLCYMFIWYIEWWFWRRLS